MEERGARLLPVRRPPWRSPAECSIRGTATLTRFRHPNYPTSPSAQAATRRDEKLQGTRRDAAAVAVETLKGLATHSLKGALFRTK